MWKWCFVYYKRYPNHLTLYRTVYRCHNSVYRIFHRQSNIQSILFPILILCVKTYFVDKLCAYNLWLWRGPFLLKRVHIIIMLCSSYHNIFIRLWAQALAMPRATYGRCMCVNRTVTVPWTAVFVYWRCPAPAISSAANKCTLTTDSSSLCFRELTNLWILIVATRYLGCPKRKDIELDIFIFTSFLMLFKLHFHIGILVLKALHGHYL